MSARGRRAVFLDRDGVINRANVRDGKPYPPDSLEDFQLLDGVEEAIHGFRAAGFLVVVATNQPDVATGKQLRAVVDAMHGLLRARGLADDIRTCFHVDADGCNCRKPKPGMLLDAAAQWGIDLARSFMVGDRWRDVDAGQAAGCFSIFIDHGYNERRPARPDAVVRSLAEAAAWIR